MIAYEFYWLRPSGGYEVIGILPERRQKPERVNHQSVMNWGTEFFGEHFETKDIFFIQVTIDKSTVRLFRPIPISITPEKISR
jgi:hypothetical protein